MKKTFTILLSILCTAAVAQKNPWPEMKTEMKPGTRWWWMGSAVDSAGLDYNLKEYASKGIGTVEITPIYGVRGNETNERQYLSHEWMDAYRYTKSLAAAEGMNVDMNGGTGWPFGGPQVSMENAATKVIFEQYTLEEGSRLKGEITPSEAKNKQNSSLYRVMAYGPGSKILDLTSKVKDGHLDWTAPSGSWKLIAVFNGKTGQKVKRAAPGGEGLVMNHFSEKAVADYLGHLEGAFAKSDAPYPSTFFNDSYEVYGGDWTPDLFEQFARRRGYKLEDHLPEFLANPRTETGRRIVSDYRETLGELLLENFTRQWTAWAHKHGSRTRNQAHGSPANLIDIYAAVDIPECESFGITDFGIKGLRVDSVRKINDSDLSMLKYASSAAHITGKPLTSSETFTWLTEHFRTSLSQCKPDLDQLFCAGVNRVFFHGTTYSPPEEAWPGWKFYASVDMSPTNTIWHDAGAMFDYITRCQSLLQSGKPDNDLLLYFPVYDLWHEQDGRLLLFDIHKMQRRAPGFIAAVNSIINEGYDVDYISDNYLLRSGVKDGKIVTSAGVSYNAIVVPGVDKMPQGTLKHLTELARQGATVVFLDGFPSDVPGYANLESRRKTFKRTLAAIDKGQRFDRVNTREYGRGRIVTGSDYGQTLAASGTLPESAIKNLGMQYIRRKTDDGYLYFVANLSPNDINQHVHLTKLTDNVLLLDPMDGSFGKIHVNSALGLTGIHLQLASGQSVFIRTFDRPVEAPAIPCFTPGNMGLILSGGWQTDRFYNLSPGSWTELPGGWADKFSGAMIYSNTFTLPQMDSDEWMLDLGDVRESARVRINGREAATLWSVPFRTMVGKYLRQGENTIEVEVTNLPANRIADHDRRGVEWRKFKDANIVKLDYNKGDFSDWAPMPSGLLGPVTLTPMYIDEN